MRAQEPNWQPVTMVGPLTVMVAEQLADTRTALALIEQARPTRPDAKVLGDEDVSEIRRVYGVMAEDYEHLFAEQGRRWQRADLTAAQRGAVDAYVALVDAHCQALAAILDLAGEIEPWTIEKVLAKSDLELGIETWTRFGHRS
jgi:hypothetical protein